MVDQQNFSEIGITDDFMFATVFKQNKAACKRLLERPAARAWFSRPVRL